MVDGDSDVRASLRGGCGGGRSFRALAPVARWSWPACAAWSRSLDHPRLPRLARRRLRSGRTAASSLRAPAAKAAGRVAAGPVVLVAATTPRVGGRATARAPAHRAAAGLPAHAPVLPRRARPSSPPPRAPARPRRPRPRQRDPPEPSTAPAAAAGRPGRADRRQGRRAASAGRAARPLARRPSTRVARRAPESAPTSTAGARLLPLERLEREQERLLEPLADAPQELRGVGAVEDAVVAGQREAHDVADRRPRRRARPAWAPWRRRRGSPPAAG